MERDEFSLKYINMRTGGITRTPVNNGVYLKTLVRVKGDARALFPTTTCLQIFDGMEFYSEMKLNIFKKSHPDFERQRENLRKLICSLGVGEAYTTRLIYGTDEVAVVDGQGIYLPSTGSSVFIDSYSLFQESMQFRADAIITDRRDVALIMYAADCPTAFLRDSRTGAIGVLHSMWRGLVIDKEDGEKTSIVKSTIEAMESNFGTNPEDLEVTVFPCIGHEQFEVGAEVVAQFEEHGLGDYAYYDINGAQHILLRNAFMELFKRNGVKANNIEVTPFTTADYGLNSLRMAPTNFTTGKIGMTGSAIYDYAGYSKEEGAIPIRIDYDPDEGKIRSNALNFLIAMRD